MHRMKRGALAPISAAMLGLLSACAAGDPVHADFAPPYAAAYAGPTAPPRPAFEFETIPPPSALAAPAYVRPTRAQEEERRTAELLAGYQRSAAGSRQAPAAPAAYLQAGYSADAADAAVPPLPASARPGECFALVRTPAAAAHGTLASEPLYESVSATLLERPARQVWKRGRGPIERFDSDTGEILCLVEEPAVYRSAARRVVQRPAELRSVPAAATLEWRRVLCDSRLDANLVRRVQDALRRAGHDPGPVDGRAGRRTVAALDDYQRARGLPPGGQIDPQTLQSLGLSY